MKGSLSILEIDKRDTEQILEFWQSLTLELASHHFQPFGVFVRDARFQQLQLTLAQSLKSDRCVVLKAESGNTLCATISAVLNTQEGYKKPESGVLFNLWVEEPFRRLGVGGELVAEAKRWLKSNGAESVQVGWHPDNQAADLFWRKQGFRHYEVIAASPL